MNSFFQRSTLYPIIMQLPSEIERLVKEFAQPCAATLRPNWREGSSINTILTCDQWWEDYIFGWGHMHQDQTWEDWCKEKIIIGPPRARSDHELTGFDEDYLVNCRCDDFRRHYVPWAKTWPAPGDHSWCKVRGVPDWAKEEFILYRIPLTYDGDDEYDNAESDEEWTDM